MLDYQFEMRQMLRVAVYDSDRGAQKLDDNDHIGSMECSLGEVLAADGAGLTRQLVGGEKADQTITDEIQRWWADAPTTSDPPRFLHVGLGLASTQIG